MTFDLLDVLPAGEWTNIQIVDQPLGLMASNEWAVLAKATCVRDGGKAAFIKFVLEAGTRAGVNTRMMTSGSRLDAIYERLQRLRQLVENIPIVPLLDVQRTANGLLIGMEEVTPLRKLIDKGEAYHLSARPRCRRERLASF